MSKKFLKFVAIYGLTVTFLSGCNFKEGGTNTNPNVTPTPVTQSIVPTNQPVVEITPLEKIITDKDKYIGKKVVIEAIFKTGSRSGIILYDINNKELRISVVDDKGVVLMELPGVPEYSKIKIEGIIMETKGFNITNNIGITKQSITVLGKVENNI